MSELHLQIYLNYINNCIDCEEAWSQSISGHGTRLSKSKSVSSKYQNQRTRNKSNIVIKNYLIVNFRPEENKKSIGGEESKTWDIK